MSAFETREEKSERLLTEGLANLKAGLDCRAWVAREVLSVSKDCNAHVVIASVHKRIHEADRLVTDEDSDQMAMMAIIAGSVLLKKMKK